MDSHHTIRFSRPTIRGDVVASVMGIDQPPAQVWQMQGSAYGGKPHGEHIEHVLVLRVPGRSVWGGIGSARDYAPTEFQVYLGHFVDPSEPMGLGDQEPSGVTCAIGGGCAKLPQVTVGTEAYFRCDRVADFPTRQAQWPRS
jgi:hypothetical protein